MNWIALILGVSTLCGCAAENRPPQAHPILDTNLEQLGNFSYDQENGGNIPERVKRLSGSTVRVVGFMVPSEQAENITEFALMPGPVGDGGTQPAPLIQQIMIVDCPPGKTVNYYPDRLAVTGKLTVAEKKDDGYIISIFQLDATSVMPASK